jgi:hypothetical protein
MQKIYLKTIPFSPLFNNWFCFRLVGCRDCTAFQIAKGTVSRYFSTISCFIKLSPIVAWIRRDILLENCKKPMTLSHLYQDIFKWAYRHCTLSLCCCYMYFQVSNFCFKEEYKASRSPINVVGWWQAPITARVFISLSYTDTSLHHPAIIN